MLEKKEAELLNIKVPQRKKKKRGADVGERQRENIKYKVSSLVSDVAADPQGVL